MNLKGQDSVVEQIFDMDQERFADQAFDTCSAHASHGRKNLCICRCSMCIRQGSSTVHKHGGRSDSEAKTNTHSTADK